MKKIIPLYLITVFFIVPNTRAQFKKGMRMAGASVGIAYVNSEKNDFSYPPPTTGYTSNNNNFGISLDPSMGWFISDHTAVGAMLNLGYRHQKIFEEANGTTFNNNKTSTFKIGVGGFVRNYFSSTGNMKPFGQFSLDFGMGSSSQEGFRFSGNDKNTFDGKSSGDFYANAGLKFGFTKMLNAHTGLDFTAGYQYSYNKFTFKTTTLTDIGNNGTIDQTAVSEPTNKYSNHGFAFGIGFQVFLDARK